jgi:hypothetical protein
LLLAGEATQSGVVLLGETLESIGLASSLGELCVLTNRH